MGTTNEEYLLMFEKHRLQTFEKKWKTLRGYKNCTPAKFAAAGFFYAGSPDMPDNVKCFACRKELNEWTKNDDPWVEHQKRGSNCRFVQMKMKGVTTVEDFLRLYFEVRKNVFIEYIDETIDKLNEQRNEFFDQLKHDTSKEYSKK